MEGVAIFAGAVTMFATMMERRAAAGEKFLKILRKYRERHRMARV
jgi:hypothetical protein